MDIMTTARERMVRVVAEALADNGHGYHFKTGVGGICPGCDHVYFERPHGAYMDPDLNWLYDAVAEHKAEAVVAALEAEMGLRENWQRVCTCGGWSEDANTPIFSHFMNDQHDEHCQVRLVTDWVSDDEGDD